MLACDPLTAGRYHSRAKREISMLRLLKASLLLLTLAAAVDIGGAKPAGAAACVANTTVDSGPGSLRQAVIDANANNCSGAINVTATGVIHLTSGTLSITHDVTINGPGALMLEVNGGDTFEIFSVSGLVTGTISGLSLQHGFAAAHGGAIRNRGTLILRDVAVGNSTAGIPGCIA